MKRFLFNLAWFVMAVIVVDMVPILFFFLMHRFDLLGSLAPQVIATLLFLVLIGGQAFFHLHFLNRMDPSRADRNVWTMIATSALVFLTYWVIIISMIVWAVNAPQQS
ncbi:MAG: hypothetical protein WC911_10775 [Thermoleophilia bacterium]